ncbi:MAG: SCO family protein [Cyclonatronaceae bacterium]
MKLITNIEQYFMSWRFPVFMLATMFLFWVLILIMAFIPVTESAFGSFAEDFKVWCFGYDPETGSMKYIYLVMYTVNPAMLAGVIVAVWSTQLREVLAAPARMVRYVVHASVLVLVVSLGFLSSYETQDESFPEFRAEALRVSLNAPVIRLTDQDEQIVQLDDYRGRVVLLTSVYASCADTCPLILQQARRVLEGVDPALRNDLVFMAVTMQPEKDTPELLKRVAGFYHLDEYAPAYHLLTGGQEEVDQVLDVMNVARIANPATGEIEHVNIFYFIDREGRIAYRFTLGEIQEEWMIQAAELLLAETGPTEQPTAEEQLAVDERKLE